MLKKISWFVGWLIGYLVRCAMKIGKLVYASILIAAENAREESTIDPQPIDRTREPLLFSAEADPGWLNFVRAAGVGSQEGALPL